MYCIHKTIIIKKDLLIEKKRMTVVTIQNTMEVDDPAISAYFSSVKELIQIYYSFNNLSFVKYVSVFSKKLLCFYIDCFDFGRSLFEN